jgi:hypothetical protein
MKQKSRFSLVMAAMAARASGVKNIFPGVALMAAMVVVVEMYTWLVLHH